jgi:hypothetical protein
MDEKAYGVSIITCTNKLYFMENIFANYENQEWVTKELILILNNEKLDIKEWEQKANQYQNVTVYQQPDEVSLGACLNFAINKAKYENIAKFDDDDFYAPLYLTEALYSLQSDNIQIVGKRSYYLYIENKNQLLIRFPNRENRKVKMVHGGTIVAKKEVFEQVPFLDISLGEDKYFFQQCIDSGFIIYSTSRFHYTYLRRDEKFHTWKASMGYLLRTSKRVSITADYKKFTDPNAEI